MLQRLKVENYALIESLELELDPHLNILTGETGAGKSILLGALALLLGGRSDGSAIKDNSRNCLVEGTFDLSGLELEEFFTRNDLDYEPVTLITRQITPSGKSRAFVNDTPVQLATLKALGTQLIDIHSQHQNLILSSEEFRLRALDTLAGTSDALARYRSLYDRLHALRRELAALRAEAEQGRRDQEWLQYQVEELTSARPARRRASRPWKPNWPCWKMPTASARPSPSSAMHSTRTNGGCSCGSAMRRPLSGTCAQAAPPPRRSPTGCGLSYWNSRT